MGAIIWLLVSDEVRLFASNWANLAAYILFGAAIYALVILTMAVFYRRQQGCRSWLMGRHLADIEVQPQGAPL